MPLPDPLLAALYAGAIVGLGFGIDFIVLLLSLIYLDLTRAMYTLVAIIVGARVIDFVLEGASGARSAFIIIKGLIL